jgi:hypothetical protein
MHFDFISEQGSGRKHRDLASRHLIRRRATQAAAQTKRKEGTIRRTNSLQLPPWAVDDTARSDLVEERQTRALPPPPQGVTIINNVQIDYYVPEQTISRPPRGLSTTIRTENIPSLLAALAIQAQLIGSLLSRFTLPIEHLQIGKLLKLSDPEFLSQLSAKYGQSRTLDAAIMCLVARIKVFLNGPVELENPRYLYCRALQTLQRALSESTEFMENLWYATPTLVLFELLDASSNTSWVQHARGSIRLLKQVGAGNIRTESQKVLLGTQIPIIVIEALMSAGDCFLDEPEWQAAIRRGITRDGPPLYFRSEMIIQLSILAAKVPNLFNQVASTVKRSATNFVPTLQSQLLEIKSGLDTWNTRWGHLLDRAYDDANIEWKRIFHRANSHCYAAIVSRLLLALDTTQCLDLEVMTLSMARQAAQVASLTTSVRLTFAKLLSQSIITTSEQWQEDCMFSDQPIVSKSVLVDWERAMGRPALGQMR